MGYLMWVNAARVRSQHHQFCSDITYPANYVIHLEAGVCQDSDHLPLPLASEPSSRAAGEECPAGGKPPMGGERTTDLLAVVPPTTSPAHNMANGNERHAACSRNVCRVCLMGADGEGISQQ